MADLKQLEEAFLKADSAGNTEDAQVFATEIKRLRTERPSLLRRAAELPIGGFEAGLSLLSGATAAPLAGISGIAQGAKNLVSEGMPAGDRVRQVQSSLTYQPKTSVGKKQVEIVSYPFEKLAEGADVVGGKVTDVTQSPALGAVANTAVQSIPSVIGKVVSPLTRSAALAEKVKLAREKLLNAPKDAALIASKEAGFTISPAEANPTVLNRLLEGFSGQAKVQQLASAKSRPFVNATVRKGLGIPEDSPIDMASLEKVRRDAGNSGYEPVRNSGRIITSKEYTSDLNKISSKYVGAEKDFPKMASDDVRNAVDSARVPEFDAGSGLDAIKIQRQRADKAFRVGDTELGKSHKAVADAIESEIERSLSQAGPTRMLADFRKAREIIAKSYDVQKALKGNDVDPRILAAQLKKGRPLSGELATVAEFGDRFKGSAQTGMKNAYAPGFLDFSGGGLAGLGAFLHSPEAATAALTGAGVAALRPAIRGLITSKPYQNMFVNPPSYNLPLTKGLADMLTRDPALAAQLAGQASIPN